MTQKVEKLKLMKRLIMFSLLILAIGCKSKEDNVAPAVKQFNLGQMFIAIKTPTGTTVVNQDGSASVVYITETKTINAGCVNIGNGSATYYYQNEEDELGAPIFYTSTSSTICYGDK